ncbi:hypothetical protein [Mesobacillus sp. S13]|nr:hypothetical protein [Mesobacillus sp. S13]
MTNVIQTLYKYLGKRVFFDLEDVALDDEVILSDSHPAVRR